jgi:hypothetical protein
MSAEQSAEMLKDMRSEVSTMTMIDVHAHFLSDFYRDALLVAGLRQADGITQLPSRWQDLRTGVSGATVARLTHIVATSIVGRYESGSSTG